VFLEYIFKKIEMWRCSHLPFHSWLGAKCDWELSNIWVCSKIYWSLINVAVSKAKGAVKMGLAYFTNGISPKKW
jgi:hypothetical protein